MGWLWWLEKLDCLPLYGLGLLSFSFSRQFIDSRHSPNAKKKKKKRHSCQTLLRDHHGFLSCNLLFLLLFVLFFLWLSFVKKGLHSPLMQPEVLHYNSDIGHHNRSGKKLRKISWCNIEGKLPVIKVDQNIRVPELINGTKKM